MFNCTDARKLYHKFFENTLTGMDERRFYYHKNYEFDIDKDLDKKFDKLYDDIVNGDKRILIRYTIISVIITFLLFLILVLAIRIVFK